MKNYFNTFGRLPYTWLNLGLILAVGMTQGIGLSLFVPLLEIMTSADGPSPPLVDYQARLYGWFGVPFELPYLLGGIVVFVWAGLALNFAQRVLLGRSQTHFVWRLRSKFVSGLMEANWGHLAKQATGDNVNILISSIFRAGWGLANQVEATASALMIFIFLSFGAVFSWPLLAATLGFGVLVVLAVRPLQRLAIHFGETLLGHEQRYGFLAVDYLKNLKLIKATAAEQSVFTGIDSLHGKIARTATAKIAVLAGTYFSTQGMAVLLCVLVIGLAHGVFEVSGAHSLVFLIFIVRCAPLLAQLQQNYQAYRSEVPAIDLIDERNREFDTHFEDKNANKTIIGGLQDGITLDHVSFRYSGSDRGVLLDVDLTILKGAMVAFVGESGAGKSTLIDLISGLRYAEAGRILIDGHDMRGINLKSWRLRIGYVGQDVLVFNQTFLHNLTFAHPNASEDDIREAIDAAHLRDVVEALPDGLETVLGESGVRLSGGQLQRLALARALIGKPDLLLLDEATSALDYESEKIVQEAIEALAHELTIVIVAHRLSTVQKADTIYLLDKGRVAETGTYQELLQGGGRFSKLHQMQFLEVS